MKPWKIVKKMPYAGRANIKKRKKERKKYREKGERKTGRKEGRDGNRKPKLGTLDLAFDILSALCG